MSNKNAVLSVLSMSEAQMMTVDVLTLYQAFYALPTHISPVMCDLSTGRGLDRLNAAERDVAERIVRTVQKRCPMPEIGRWPGYRKPAANDATKTPQQLRINL
jgi:hypothetical protein